MTTTTASTPAGVETCPAAEAVVVPRQPLFPPADADAETYRAWLATSPWPEVVFASAGLH